MDAIDALKNFFPTNVTVFGDPYDDKRPIGNVFTRKDNAGSDSNTPRDDSKGKVVRNNSGSDSTLKNILAGAGATAGGGVAGVVGKIVSEAISANSAAGSELQDPLMQAQDIELDEFGNVVTDAEGKIPITRQPMSAETEGLFQQTLEEGASSATETVGAAESGGLVESAMGIVQGIGDAVAGGTAELLGGGAVAEAVGGVAGAAAETISVISAFFL